LEASVSEQLSLKNRKMPRILRDLQLSELLNKSIVSYLPFLSSQIEMSLTGCAVYQILREQASMFYLKRLIMRDFPA
jgi:hypothetical protein